MGASASASDGGRLSRPRSISASWSRIVAAFVRNCSAVKNDVLPLAPQLILTARSRIASRKALSDSPSG